MSRRRRSSSSGGAKAASSIARAAKGRKRWRERLTSGGIRALPYHAGLEAECARGTRRCSCATRTQVICATVAFGMGINKSNVRFVIHYDLPKNLEGYYQETGRAGRDGLPSECLLLFSAGDAVKQTALYRRESRRAGARDRPGAAAADGALRGRCHLPPGHAAGVLRRDLSRAELRHVRQLPRPRARLLTARSRRRNFSPASTASSSAAEFGVGLNHVVEVLTGALTEKIQRWGHQQLSTYGIGKEHSRPEWQHIGRELMRLGFCEQLPGKFPTLALTPAGLHLLKTRPAVTLSRPLAQPARATRGARGDIECDEALFEKLRVVRKGIADLRDVPAYVVFSDVALRLMAREYPQKPAEFARISGVGDEEAGGVWSSLHGGDPGIPG